MLAAAKAQLGRTEETVHDQDVPIDTGIGDLRFTLWADDEQGRKLPLHYAAREFDIVRRQIL